MGREGAFTPKSETELADWLRARTAPCVIEGQATRRAPCATGLAAISTAALSGVTLYEPEALTLVAQAGTPLRDIETLLEAHGQMLAFEPLRLAALLGHRDPKRWGSIGGALATNSSGARRIAVGACRDFCLGIRFVDGQGRIVKNGGRVMKNVTGYDLVKLFAGSWGKLGVITEVSFKTLPSPETQKTLVVEAIQTNSAVALMTLALNTPFEISAATYEHNRAKVALRLEGFENAVNYRMQSLMARIGHSYEIHVLEAEESKKLWHETRKIASLGDQEGAIWAINCKPSEAPSLLERIDFRDALLDWGGGRIWVCTSDEEDLRLKLGAFTGFATYFRGKNQSSPRHHPQSKAKEGLDRAIAQRFDPKALFHSGGKV